MGILSDYYNFDVMLGEMNSNSLERELHGVLNGPKDQQDSEFVPNMETSSQENETRDIYNGNDTTGRDRLTEV